MRGLLRSIVIMSLAGGLCGSNEGTVSAFDLGGSFRDAARPDPSALKPDRSLKISG